MEKRILGYSRGDLMNGWIVEFAGCIREIQSYNVKYNPMTKGSFIRVHLAEQMVLLKNIDSSAVMSKKTLLLELEAATTKKDKIQLRRKLKKQRLVCSSRKTKKKKLRRQESLGVLASAKCF